VSFDPILKIELRPPALTNPVPSLRVGMVGLGRFVQNNVLAAYRSRGYNVVAACDPDEAARERAERQWSITSTYADYLEMLDKERLDAVDINLRWDRGMSAKRVEVVRACAQRGIHVQLAKPLGATWDQCRTIVDIAKQYGILLSVNQNSRYAPSFYATGALLRAGALGPLLSAHLAWDAARGLQHRPDFDAVHDVSVHQVDVVLSWFDQEPELVFADQTRKTEIGSVLNVIMRFSDGSNGSVRDDFASELRRAWPFTVVGEIGSVDGTDDIEVPEPGQPRMQRGFLRVGLHRHPGAALELPLTYRYAPESFAATMGDLLQAIDQGSAPWAGGDNVLRTMRTLFAVEESVRSGLPARPGSIGATAAGDGATTGGGSPT
jgi:predicted dehydrogenase